VLPARPARQSRCHEIDSSVRERRQEPVSIVGSYIGSMLGELSLGVIAKLLLAPVVPPGADQAETRGKPPSGP
jgi:hypothetical protein